MKARTATNAPAKGRRRRRKGAKKQGPHPVDVLVGSRLRSRRILRGLSQEKLAGSVGLTFQQIQKYERGTNRISASRLYEFACILDMPIAYFFEDSASVPESGMSSSAKAPSSVRSNRTLPTELMQASETLKLVRAYYQISDPKTRATIRDLIKACAKVGRK